MFDEKKASTAVRFIKLLKHTQGEFARKPFNLMPFQEKIVKELIGTLNKDGTRQYREAFIFLPRKNGKTELIAAMLVYFLFMDDEYGAEIYSCANDREQASKVFSAAAAMIRMNKALFKKCKILESQKKIVRIETNSFYKAISADTNTKDGFNAHIVIYDEIHASKNRKLYDLMKTSQGARTQPLFISITTAGVETGTICYELYEYSKKILDHIIEDKTFYPVVYEAPEDADIYDEKVWYEANPALGVFRKIEEMRQLAVRAKEIPTAEATFRRLYLNQWVNGEVAWMDMKKWRESDREFNFDELRGQTCIVGIDLSSKIDLTSVNVEFKLESGEYVMLSHSFMPKNRVLEREKQDRVPYSLWIKQGYITATEGDVVDYDYIKQYIRDIHFLYPVSQIGYDPYNATQFATDMEKEGFLMVEVRQGVLTLSEPTKDVEALVLQKRIITNKNPVLTWAISNAIAKTDANENKMLDKSKTRFRIDPAAAMIISHTLARIDTGEVDINEHIMSEGFGF